MFMDVVVKKVEVKKPRKMMTANFLLLLDNIRTSNEMRKN